MPSAMAQLNAVLDCRSVRVPGGSRTVQGPRERRRVELRLGPGPLRGSAAAPWAARRKLHYCSGLKAHRDTDAASHWVLDLEAGAAGSAKW